MRKLIKSIILDICPSQRGTTVHVANLFAGMPVRKKEFDRNSKKHFAAAQTLLQAYGLISVGKRISLSNQQEYASGNPLSVFWKTMDQNDQRKD